MTTVTLGRTGITVNKNGFGALPIQRITKEEAAYLLRKAYNGGITLFDTARAYSDSEEKIGYAMSDIRNHIYITTKTAAKNAEDFWKDLEKSLSLLKTDHIDVYQFHNPSFCPKPGDGTGLYEAMLEAKAQGKIKHIGITTHRINVAKEAIATGMFETIQYPFNYLASDDDKEVYRLSQEANMGFICMKAMSGGLIGSPKAAYAFLNDFDGLVPIWGIQRESELDDFLNFAKENVTLTDDLKAIIEKDRNDRQLLPWLRILHEFMSRTDKNRRLCKNVTYDKTRAFRKTSSAGNTGKNEKNRKLYPLRSVCRQMSLRP